VLQWEGNRENEKGQTVLAKANYWARGGVFCPLGDGEAIRFLALFPKEMGRSSSSVYSNSSNKGNKKKEEEEERRMIWRRWKRGITRKRGGKGGSEEKVERRQTKRQT